MTALLYLFFTRLKNRLREMLRKPGQLVYIILMLALLVFVISSGGTEVAAGERPITEFYAICFVLFFAMFMLSVYKGLSTGGSFYTMSDVNFLFPAPISPRRILTYGLIRQLGTSLLIGFFILYQYGLLREFYGITPADLLVVFLGYGLTLFCGQLSAMALYSYSSHDDQKQTRLRVVFYGIILVVAAVIAYPWLTSSLEAAVSVVNSTAMHCVPVVGWIAAITTGLLSGNWLAVALGLLGVLLFSVLVILSMRKQGSGFYEDVLQATELSHSALMAAKEGGTTETTPKNIKVGKMGFSRGSGATAFYYKHKIETRRGRFLLFQGTTIMFIIMAIAFSYFMQDIGSMGIFTMITYFQLFSTVSGRWAREFLQPYIYLVPDNPVKKLIWLCREQINQISLEAVIIILSVGLIMGLPFDVIIAMVVARISFGVLYMAGTLLLDRLFPTLTNRTLSVLLFMFMAMILSLPGAITMGVSFIFLPETLLFLSGECLAFLAMALVNAAMALLVFFLSRNMLQYAELNMR
jgi:hypothetical protein